MTALILIAFGAGMVVRITLGVFIGGACAMAARSIQEAEAEAARQADREWYAALDTDPSFDFDRRSN